MVQAPELVLYGVPTLLAGGEFAFAPERRFQLLALLAFHRAQWVPRDRLAALLWPEQGQTQARRNLRNVLFKAPASPGTAPIQANDHALRWDVDTDLLHFEQALREQRLDEAVALRRGTLLEGLDDPRNDALGQWLAAERDRLDARWRQAALQQLAGLAEDPQRRRGLAERLLQFDLLDEEAVAALIEADLALGHTAHARRCYLDFSHRLAEALGVEPSHRLRDLLADKAAAPASFRPPTATASTPHIARSFVGRRAEVAELCARLVDPQARQVTILGPGGVGKSSLAQQLAVRAAAAYPGGVHWIALEDIDDAAAVAARLARRLDVVLADAHDPVDQLARALPAQRVLAVFDNAEHLPELAGFIDRLLTAAPALSALVTSRRRLHGRHEQAFVLEGLAVPDEDSRDLDAAGAFDSVRLFEARAGASQRGFDLARHLQAVIDCVEAVAGMPLAIELTASWVRLLPPDEIIRELRRSIDLLERDPAQPDAPARPEHRSLRAVLDGSWQLLSPAEQQALAALSVFRGGFVTGAARAVAGVPITVLSSLTDKSLLAVDATGRFGLHPLVQAHAAERLQADPSRAERIADRHAEHYAQSVAELVRAHVDDVQPMVSGIEAELSNVLAAWRHAVAHALPDRIAAMAPGLRATYHVRGRMAEGVAQISPALALPARGPASTAALGQVQHAIAALRYHRRDLAEGAAFAAAGLASAEACQDRRLQFACLATLGACHSTAGCWQQAAPIFERALAIAVADGERGETARALVDLGVIAKKGGSFDLALERYGQALAINQELGRHDAAARCLNNIGVLWMERNDWARARDVMKEGVALCERHRNDSLLPYLLNGLGLALFELGELDLAERHLERALQRSRETEVLSVEMLANCLLARAATRRGRHAEAEARFRAAAQMARRLELVTDLLDIALYYAECQRDSGRRLEAARTWAMVAGHPNAEAGIRASATHWADALALDEGERAALAAAPTSLDEVIDRLLAAEGRPA